MRRARLGLLMVVLSACWKRETVVQPKLTFEVRDERGPVVGAKVRLMTITDPYHQRQALADVVTDAQGLGSFEEHRERIWVFPLMMHGVTFFNWEWCVEAEGHAAQRGQAAAQPTVSLQLLAAPSDETCGETNDGLVIQK